ncbi:MAG: c-type cytochrome [Acidobacteria bacterium]|nr:c-type cytochrome [Acidobacteriota bacterium]
MSRWCAWGWGAMMVAVVSLGLTASAEQTTPRAEAAKLKNPVASNAASLATGQQLYQKYCRFCHGTTGRGDSPTAPKTMKPSNIVDDTWDRGSSDGEIFVVIQEGAGPDYKMKGLKGKVTDQDTWHLVNYVRSLAGATK